MTMQDTMINQELASLDLSKVAGLQQKRTLAFVNHFVITTVQFLNSFMKECEHKLMLFERKLEKVEAAMVLLEARLSSIPEVNTPQTEIKEENIKTPVSTTESTEHAPDSSKPEDIQKTIENTPVMSPEYERFVKMVQVGVPLDAVKLKVSLEGLDPELLVKILGK